MCDGSAAAPLPPPAPERPHVATIPSADAAFRTLVERLLDELGATATTQDLQTALRTYRPRALVRASVLSRVPAVWYVYRDGGFRPLPPTGRSGAIAG